MPIPVGAVEVERDFDVKTQHEPSFSGAEQMIARRPAIVAWLGKVVGEMRGKHKRDVWSRVFNERKLVKFLHECGVDLDAVTKANESTLPLPQEVGDAACCFNNLRGAPFLKLHSEAACDLIRTVEQGSPHRR